MPRSDNGRTAVARRESTALQPAAEQHPVIAQIEAKMPQIAEMLPAHMDAQRFRRVVVQALVKNPDLWQCTPVSVVSSIVEAAEMGLEPTGVLGRAWLIPYNVNVGTRDNPSWEKRAQLQVGYRGYTELAWRADRIQLEADLVYPGDDFAYQRGTNKFLRHVPKLDVERDDKSWTHAYAVYTLPDGRTDFEVMTRAQVEAIRDRARKKNPVWDSDPGEMSKKTAVRRLTKRAPLSAQMQRVIARDEELDFGPVDVTPEVAATATRSAARRERIASRRQRPEAQGRAERPPDAPPCPHPTKEQVARDDGLYCGRCDLMLASREPAAEAEPGRRPRGGREPKKPGDEGYWSDRVHAAGAEKGLDHEALRKVAAAVCSVDEAALDLPARDKNRFSVKQLVEAEWEALDEVVRSLPAAIADPDADKALDAVAPWVYERATAKKLTDWQAIDTVVAGATDRQPDELSVVDWIAFGIRLANGQYDAQRAKATA